MKPNPDLRRGSNSLNSDSGWLTSYYLLLMWAKISEPYESWDQVLISIFCINTDLFNSSWISLIPWWSNPAGNGITKMKESRTFWHLSLIIYLCVNQLFDILFFKLSRIYWKSFNSFLILFYKQKRCLFRTKNFLGY